MTFTNCDVCAQPINSGKEAYVEWQEVRTPNGYESMNFKIVHYIPYSPIRNCYADRHGERPNGYRSLEFNSIIDASGSKLLSKVGHQLSCLEMADTSSWREFCKRVALIKCNLHRGVDGWNSDRISLLRTKYEKW